jgi:SAM-dependent methyltransferase
VQPPVVGGHAAVAQAAAAAVRADEPGDGAFDHGPVLAVAGAEVFVGGPLVAGLAQQRVVFVQPEALAARYAGTNVEVIRGDATDLDLADATFDAAGCFTKLHHVPTVALQNRLLAEVLRVLRPGGVLVGSDSLPSDGLHRFHEGDTYNPVEPGTLLIRLQTLGYERITVGVGAALTFIAHRTAAPDTTTTPGAEPERR